MSVELWIGKEFDTAYERKALDVFVTDMEARFGESKNLHLVLADYYIDGRQVDLTVLKRDAIVIIELKECKESFTATENNVWNTPDGHILGEQTLNPYQQIQQYRLKWVNFLKRNRHIFRCFATTKEEKPYWHISGVVAISPSLHIDSINRISSWWFSLCGLNNLAKTIGFQTNHWMDFSDDELRKLAAELLSLKFKPHMKQDHSASWAEKEKQLRVKIEAEVKEKLKAKLREEIEADLLKIQIQKNHHEAKYIAERNVKEQYSHIEAKKDVKNQPSQTPISPVLNSHTEAKKDVKNQPSQTPISPVLKEEEKKEESLIQPKSTPINQSSGIVFFKYLTRLFVSWALSVYVLGRIAVLFEYNGHAEIKINSPKTRFFIIIGIIIAWFLLGFIEKLHKKLVQRILLIVTACFLPFIYLINVHNTRFILRFGIYIFVASLFYFYYLIFNNCKEKI